MSPAAGRLSVAFQSYDLEQADQERVSTRGSRGAEGEGFFKPWRVSTRIFGDGEWMGMGCWSVGWWLQTEETAAWRASARTSLYLVANYPLSKWVITPVISGLTLLIPFTTWDEPPSIHGNNHSVDQLLDGYLLVTFSREKHLVKPSTTRRTT